VRELHTSSELREFSKLIPTTTIIIIIIIFVY